VQLAPFGPDDPELQEQLVKAELPTGEMEIVGHLRHVCAAVAPTEIEYVPASHSVHTADPVDGLYLPGTHVVHIPPSCPLEPISQTQAVIFTLALGDTEFDWHRLQGSGPFSLLQVFSCQFFKGYVSHSESVWKFVFICACARASLRTFWHIYISLTLSSLTQTYLARHTGTRISIGIREACFADACWL